MLLGDKLSLIFWQAFNENIGKQTGESYKQIQRYIRLTFLQLRLMGMVDCKGIAFNSEMEVSNLPMEEQPKEGMPTLNALTAAEPARFQQGRIACSVFFRVSVGGWLWRARL